MSTNPPNQLWLDLETTGLNPESHAVIEVAAVLTHVAGGELIVDHEMSAVLNPQRDNWTLFCLMMHQTSGLTAEIKEGKGVESEDFFRRLTTKVRMWKRPKDIVLAGRSVHFDRSFLKVFAPELETYLHHRHLDMSAVEMFLEHTGVNVVRPENATPHRAKADLQYAMNQYREFLSLASGPLRGKKIG